MEKELGKKGKKYTRRNDKEMYQRIGQFQCTVPQFLFKRYDKVESFKKGACFLKSVFEHQCYCPLFKYYFKNSWENC